MSTRVMYEYTATSALEGDAANYIVIPEDIYLTNEANDHLVSVYAYFYIKRGLDNTISFSVNQIVKWLGRQPNRNKTGINNKVIECIEYLQSQNYLSISKKLNNASINEAIFNSEKANRKTNSFYFPSGYNFGVCFYDNYDGYFIFDKEDFEFIKTHHCTALVNKVKGRVDPQFTVNGKHILLARWLMNTPDELEVDHINHDTNDLRKCNLRNCTKEQNNYNKIKAKQGVVKLRNDGKYIIVDFPKENVMNLVFATREDALDVLFALQDKYYGEFGKRRSQAIGEKYQTDYFNHGVVACNGILEEIQNLHEKNVYKIWLDNIFREFKTESISDVMLGERLHELTVAYQNRDK